VNVIDNLQHWFETQCDGKWEHDNGITIETTDNPGWWVKINLKGTVLSDRQFVELQSGDLTSADQRRSWLRCYVADGVFNGIGGSGQLAEILEIFLKWAA
jgi:hypothetical protein